MLTFELVNKDQIIYCLSQLKRFTKYFKAGNTDRILQFGYNLGRLQQLCITPDQKIFWQPIEKFINNLDWYGLDAYIDELKEQFSVEYDMNILAK